MTGLEALREEMKKRGLNQAQCESKVAAVVLDILANTPDKRFAAEWDHEQAVLRLESQRRDLERKKQEFEREKQEHKEDFHKEWDKIRKQNQEIDTMRNQLTEAETPEARDKIRLAEYFKKSIDKTKISYNGQCELQFIRSLGMILSDWKQVPKEEK